MKLVKFLNCKIDVSKGVFKPRIETEFWVKRALRDCKLQISSCRMRNVKILDIFSGSGCIGIAVLKNIKNCKVDFADIDKRAIEQIKINLRLNDIPKERYKIYKSNLFEKLKRKKYDFIFANPPYVAKERVWEVQESVKKFEPKISWYGGEEGMKIIKKFLKEAKNHLKRGGEIFMEFDPFQFKKIEKILKKERYSSFKFFKDQFRKWRYVEVFY